MKLYQLLSNDNSLKLEESPGKKNLSLQKELKRMKNIFIVCLLSFNVVSGYSCRKNSIKDNTGLINRSDSAIVNISTDKAVYLPGSQVMFKIDKELPAGTIISYKYLNKEVYRQTLTGNTWKWTAPVQDFTGYMVELSGNDNGKNKIYGCIAVDVS